MDLAFFFSLQMSWPLRATSRYTGIQPAHSLTKQLVCSFISQPFGSIPIFSWIAMNSFLNVDFCSVSSEPVQFWMSSFTGFSLYELFFCLSGSLSQCFLFAQTCEHVLVHYTALSSFILFHTDILLCIYVQANHVNYWVSCVCCQEKNMQPSKLGESLASNLQMLS